MKKYTTVRHIVLIWFILPLCKAHEDCRVTLRGTAYTGTVNVTTRGESCLRWDSHVSTIQHPYGSTDSEFPESPVTRAENYCRNPGGQRSAPWCYRTPIKTRLCDIPVCGNIECLVSPTGEEYSGALNTTSNGITCQRWDAQTPHAHANYVTDADFPFDADVTSAANYCRNPGGADQRPWCYTTNPGVESGYCDILPCAVPTETKILDKQWDNENWYLEIISGVNTSLPVCSSEAYPGADIKWALDGIDLPRLPEDSWINDVTVDRALERTNSTLVYPLEPEQNGTTLTCLAKSTLTSDWYSRDSVTLRVLYFHVGDSETTLTVTLGSTVILLCGVTGNPSPLYVWDQDGQEVEGADWATLTLANITEADVGAYSCNASSTMLGEVYQGTTVTYVQIEDDDPPVSNSVATPVSTEVATSWSEMQTDTAGYANFAMEPIAKDGATNTGEHSNTGTLYANVEGNPPGNTTDAPINDGSSEWRHCKYTMQTDSVEYSNTGEHSNTGTLYANVDYATKEAPTGEPLYAVVDKSKNKKS